MNDQELYERFCDYTLPADEWTHRGHVKVAFYTFVNSLLKRP